MLQTDKLKHKIYIFFNFGSVSILEQNKHGISPLVHHKKKIYLFLDRKIYWRATISGEMSEKMCLFIFLSE